jgi:hypothetical protein
MTKQRSKLVFASPTPLSSELRRKFTQLVKETASKAFPDLTKEIVNH